MNAPAAGLRTLGVDGINVATNGATATVERARTLLEASVYPTVSPPSSYADIAARDNARHSGYQQLRQRGDPGQPGDRRVHAGGGHRGGARGAQAAVAACCGSPARGCPRYGGVVALEGAVPLLTVAVVAIGTGFGAAAMYAKEAQNRPMVAPGLAYYLLTVGGIIVSLAIIAATFPILTRITGPEAARND